MEMKAKKLQRKKDLSKDALQTILETIEIETGIEIVLEIPTTGIQITGIVVIPAGLPVEKTKSISFILEQ